MNVNNVADLTVLLRSVLQYQGKKLFYYLNLLS